MKYLNHLFLNIDFLWIAIAVVVLALFFDMLIVPRLRFKKQYELFSSFEELGFICEVLKGKKADFILESNDIILMIKTIVIPTNSSVTINNKDTWELAWGGSSENKGRAYPRKRYMGEVIDFLRETIKLEKRIVKVVVLYPNTEKILRYLNESELEIITGKNTPYGYKVTTFERFTEEFSDLIK